MSISTTTRKAGPYVGNSVQTVFAFAFKIFATSDVQVVRAVTATGIETILTLGVDYTVSMNADQDAAPGGTITMSVAPPATQTVVITTAVPALQSVVVTNGGGFFPAVFNAVFDKLTVLIQQLTEKIGRQLTIAISATGVTSLTIPVVPLGVLRWNSGGTALETVSTVAASLPTQTGQGGKLLTTDGANAAWTDTVAGPLTVTGTLTGSNQVISPNFINAGSDVKFGTSTSHNAYLRTNNVDRWIVTGAAGSIYPVTDNVSDFGTSSNRPANSYLRAADVSGVLTVSSGQVAFPATQIPSAGANVLDDYEEGSFTPTFAGGTTNPTAPTYNAGQTYGRYTKVGKHVFFHLRIRLTGYGAAGTGVVTLAGLPFPLANDTGMNAAYADALTGMTAQPAASGISGNSFISMEQQGANGRANLNWSNMTTGTDIMVSGHYQTTN